MFFYAVVAYFFCFRLYTDTVYYLSLIQQFIHFFDHRSLELKIFSVVTDSVTL